MTVKIHNDIGQGSSEWHALRSGLYSGSNASKLLKFGTIPYSRTSQSTFRGNFYTKRGHILEDEAVEIYEFITKRTVTRPGFVTNTAFPQCGYSPDAIDNDILIEVKCFKEDRHAAIKDGNIPLEILAQIHFGMLICELKKATLLLYNPDLEPQEALKMIPIKYNRSIQANIKRILGKEKVRA